MIYLKPLTRIRVPVSLLEPGGTEKQAILPEPRKAPGRRGGGAKGSFRFRAQKLPRVPTRRTPRGSDPAALPLPGVGGGEAGAGEEPPELLEP